MQFRLAFLLVVAPVVTAACGGAPAQPSDASPDRTLLGQTVNALDGSAAGGLTVRVGNSSPATTDANGYFQTVVDGPGTYPALIVGSGIVERATTVSGPAADVTRLTLIPASFDLVAFDEMFRSANARLQRWTTQPKLVVLGTVMSYGGSGLSEYVTKGEPIPDEEIAEMVQHLTDGLSLLTGGTYDSFAAVDVERPEAGARVSVTRPGAIVVGRYSGIVTMANTIGLGRWAEDTDGAVVAGAMFLDRSFDQHDPRRRLLRIHELGHALGYLHVTSRTSIMNPAIGPEPTAFDRAGATIAFQRPPGNRAPDADPGAGARYSSGPSGGIRWVAPIR